MGTEAGVPEPARHTSVIWLILRFFRNSQLLFPGLLKRFFFSHYAAPFPIRHKFGRKNLFLTQIDNIYHVLYITCRSGGIYGEDLFLLWQRTAAGCALLLSRFRKARRRGFFGCRIFFVLPNLFFLFPDCFLLFFCCFIFCFFSKRRENEEAEREEGQAGLAPCHFRFGRFRLWK